MFNKIGNLIKLIKKSLSPRVMEVKTKINKWGLINHKSFLHREGNQKQSKMATCRMGENIYKQCGLKGINFQNYTQLMQLSMGRRPK